MASAISAKYAPFYASPKGAGDERPTALQIVEEEGLIGKLPGKVFVITGCGSGIGVELARAIAATGARLFLPVRNLSAAEQALKGILQPGRVELVYMELASLASIRAAASDIKSRTSVVNVLICNAGIMANPYQITVDGFESQFGTNHLGHFLLFQLLKPLLLSSASPSFSSRVVTVSSTGHRGGGIRFGNENFQNGPEEYTPWAGYSQSKTANIYMANEIERRYGSKGLRGMSVTPGAIFTPLQKHMDEETKSGFAGNEPLMKQILTTAQGSALTVWAAVGKEWETKGGKYLEHLAVSPLHPDPEDMGYLPLVPGYAPHAYDEQKEGRLWVNSLKMVGKAWHTDIFARVFFSQYLLTYLFI